MKRTLLVILMLALSAVGGFLFSGQVVQPAEATCYDYHGSRMYYFDGFPYCAYSGTHCMECVTGSGVCVHDHDSGASDCYTFEEHRRIL